MRTATMQPPTKIMPDMVVAVLYAIAAVSGGLGGCTAAAYYFTHAKQPRLPFLFAYVLLGISFGVITLAALSIYDGGPHTLPELILFCLAGGSSGAVALASANFTAKIILRRLGVEVQFTLHRTEQHKRGKKVDDEDEPD